MQKVLDTNLNFSYEMSQKLNNRRDTLGGVITNISSIEVIFPFTSNLIHYNLGKAGIVSLNRALAKEFVHKGFKINAIMPGGVDTPNTRAVAERIWRNLDFGLIPTGIKYQSLIPMGRRGQPDEVACIPLFLASELSSCVQGTLILVDGGFLSC